MACTVFAMAVVSLGDKFWLESDCNRSTSLITARMKVKFFLKG